MIEVYEKKKVPETCETCLYWMGWYCGHADRENDWFRFRLFGYCPSFWLDQHRFTRAR